MNWKQVENEKQGPVSTRKTKTFLIWWKPLLKLPLLTAITLVSHSHLSPSLEKKNIANWISNQTELIVLKCHFPGWFLLVGVFINNSWEPKLSDIWVIDFVFRTFVFQIVKYNSFIMPFKVYLNLNVCWVGNLFNTDHLHNFYRNIKGSHTLRKVQFF